MCTNIIESGIGDIEPFVLAICDSFKIQDNDSAYRKLKNVIQEEIRAGNDSLPELIRIGLFTIKEFV